LVRQGLGLQRSQILVAELLDGLGLLDLHLLLPEIVELKQPLPFLFFFLLLCLL
jgi:hypothetical protein